MSQGERFFGVMAVEIPAIGEDKKFAK